MCEDYLSPEDIKKFLERRESEEVKNRDYRYVISIVGFSPDPIIFFNKLIEPEKHFFVHTEKSEKSIDEIVKQTGILPSRYQKVKISSTDTLNIYRKIKEILKDFRDEDYKKTLIDITGGKKVMVAATAMAAYLLGIDTGYIDYYEYDIQKRKPKKGTEYPVILKNPLEVFGDIEIKQARDYFEACNFERAVEVLGELKTKVPNLREVEMYLNISLIYKLWNDFDIKSALDKAKKFIEYAERGTYNIAQKLKESIKNHISLLERLLKAEESPTDDFYIPLNFYFASERYAHNKKYDLAVLLMYRTIESIAQIRLKEHGIEPSNPLPEQYEKMGISFEKWEDINKKLYKDEYTPRKELPRKIALMDGYTILKCINDKLLEGIELTQIKNTTQMRNNSVYAHGVIPLSEKEYKSISKVGKKLLDNLLSLKNAREFREYQEEFRFPQW